MVAALVMVAEMAWAQDVKPLAKGETTVTTDIKTTPPVPAVRAESVVPTVGELDGLKLDKVVLSIENLQLKLTQGKAELEKMDADARAYVATLQKPGYQLTKDQQGKWIYQVEPAKVTEAPKAPEKK
jgi:hypothetical protein